MLASARTALARAGWTAADVEVLTTHQADAATLGAGLGIARVAENPGPTSNTVAASIPLALAEITLDPGTRTLLSAFGGAGTWGAVALKWPRQNG
jgi:3-oxoacyl-[acyl-carrier-protein] synthase-3